MVKFIIVSGVYSGDFVFLRLLQTIGFQINLDIQEEFSSQVVQSIIERGLWL